MREGHSLSIARLPVRVDEEVEANLQGDEKGGAPEDGTPHLARTFPRGCATTSVGPDEEFLVIHAFQTSGDHDPYVFARPLQSSRRDTQTDDAA